MRAAVAFAGQEEFETARETAHESEPFGTRGEMCMDEKGRVKC